MSTNLLMNCLDVESGVSCGLVAVAPCFGTKLSVNKSVELSCRFRLGRQRRTGVGAAWLPNGGFSSLKATAPSGIPFEASGQV